MQFAGRLQKLQKGGFPQGVNVGRGARAEYGATHLFQLLVLFGLLDAGLLPERARQIVLEKWDVIRATVAAALWHAAGDDPTIHFLVIRMAALNDLRTSDDDSSFYVEVHSFDDHQIGSAIALKSPRFSPPMEDDDPDLSKITIQGILSRSIIVDVEILIYQLLHAMATEEIAYVPIRDELWSWIIAGWVNNPSLTPGSTEYLRHRTKYQRGIEQAYGARPWEEHSGLSRYAFFALVGNNPITKGNRTDDEEMLKSPSTRSAPDGND